MTSSSQADPDLVGLPLIAYPTSGEGPGLRVPGMRRTWMDETGDAFAYRCLPLVMANQMGWELQNRHAFSAIWNGGPGLGDISLHADEPLERHVLSHFGSGILTFNVSYLFRTPPGHNLWVKGPANRPKDGIAPLEGVVEADWGAFTFSMNWQFTRPGHEVQFQVGEPFAQLLPYPRDYLASFRPRIRGLADEPELHAAFEAWRADRMAFNEALDEPGSAAQAQGWQRHYMQGAEVGGSRFEGHQVRPGQLPFEDGETEATKMEPPPAPPLA